MQTLRIWRIRQFLSRKVLVIIVVKREKIINRCNAFKCPLCRCLWSASGCYRVEHHQQEANHNVSLARGRLAITRTVPRRSTGNSLLQFDSLYELICVPEIVSHSLATEDLRDSGPLCLLSMKLLKIEVIDREQLVH